MLFKSFIPAAFRTAAALVFVGGASLFSAPAAQAQAQTQVFAKGADVGWLQQMEATGYVFYNEQGVAQDCFQILKAQGINSIRLRVFVNPSDDKASGHCSPAEVVAMAKRAAGLGFRLMIDFTTAIPGPTPASRPSLPPGPATPFPSC
jgi:arabinogalactan endo-1,4-beta-galactosidase